MAEISAWEPDLRTRLAWWLQQQQINAGRDKYAAGVTGRQVAGGESQPLGLLDAANAFALTDARQSLEGSAKSAGEGAYGDAGIQAGIGGLGLLGAVAPVSGKASQVLKKGLLGRFETTTSGRIVNRTAADGGYSVNLPAGEVPTEGLMMGKYANTDPRNTVVDALRRPDVVQHVDKNKAALDAPDTFLGTWRDPDTGKVYVDTSRRFPDEGTAPEKYRLPTKYGERTKQIAGWDVKAKKSFPVQSWEDYVRGPDFSARLDELAPEGGAYMNQQKTKQWWDAHGTSLEDVYGTQDMPQVAGFTASTAPNEKVIKNVGEMTEYMRRFIKGEPIVQPNWRMPEDGLLFQKGSMMPMESGRAGNLVKTSRGLLDELQADKVRNEAQAMMGDPSAMPLDVYWGRVAEDPAKGVFTASKEGYVPPGKTYAILKDVVTSHALRAGDSPANYSAKVWAAIRERISKTGNLFGTKYRTNSGLGESKGYADHFNDLINQKSKMLGISAQEMRDRLTKGDANLMSVMLASPVVYGVYQQIAGDDPAQ